MDMNVVRPLHGFWVILLILPLPCAFGDTGVSILKEEPNCVQNLQGTAVPDLFRLSIDKTPDQPPSSLRTRPAPATSYWTDQGTVFRSYYQSADVDSHLVLDRQRHHLIASFSAGDSSAGIYFQNSGNAKVNLINIGTLERPVFQTPAPSFIPCMHGTMFGVETTATEFVINDILLGGMRFQRDFRDFNKPKPDAFAERIAISKQDPRVLYANVHLTDEHSYEMTIQVPDYCDLSLNGKIVTIRSRTSAPVKFTAAAWTSEKPLSPITGELTEPLFRDPTLQFLAFRQGVQAGSINYRKPFGRDSLISAMMGMLTPRLREQLNMRSAVKREMIEAMLRPILSTIDAHGRVIHEPIQSDYAYYLFGNFKTHYDRKMVDTDFLPAVAVRTYMNLFPEHVNAFLDEKAEDGGTLRQALARNLRFVVDRAADFAEHPTGADGKPRHEALIRLLPGEMTGNWRDSHDEKSHGLAGAVYPFDVNTVLVPAALREAHAIFRDSLFKMTDPQYADRAERYYPVWKKEAPKMFLVHVDATTARKTIREHALRRNIELPPQGDSLIDDSGLDFFAIGLYDDGTPAKLMHSDELMSLFFENPDPKYLKIILDRFKPFPYGLNSPVGLLIANAAFLPEDQQRYSSPESYHGEDVWSFQQGLAALGLDKQEIRRDLPPDLKRKLLQAVSTMESILATTRPHVGLEFWSWSSVNRTMTFKQAGTDVPCDPQLWSEMSKIASQAILTSFEQQAGLHKQNAGE